MYIPQVFKETDTNKLAATIRTHPFGSLVTTSLKGIEANSIPFILNTEKEPWLLQGHVARANPVWQQDKLKKDVLVLFNGPHHYISPSWYPSKEKLDGKVVPTWNYITVQAYGTISFIEDRNWLANHINELTHAHENNMVQPWSTDDSPEGFIDKLQRAIVGVEIRINELQGKWKVSQNRSNSDKLGVAEALQRCGSDNAKAIASAVKETIDTKHSQQNNNG